MGIHETINNSQEVLKH